ncbi:hypothetical protein R3P38DRAFT_2801044 [Favolaschia claudopus]|uniref:Uncharacterized protein n=1 Tax=Favolaschia claudopus TaxID=2862362 RepID=A0AAV9ZW58_9AGAR
MLALASGLVSRSFNHLSVSCEALDPPVVEDAHGATVGYEIKRIFCPTTRCPVSSPSKRREAVVVRVGAGARIANHLVGLEVGGYGRGDGRHRGAGSSGRSDALVMGTTSVYSTWGITTIMSIEGQQSRWEVQDLAEALWHRKGLPTYKSEDARKDDARLRAQSACSFAIAARRLAIDRRFPFADFLHSTDPTYPRPPPPDYTWGPGAWGEPWSTESPSNAGGDGEEFQRRDGEEPAWGENGGRWTAEGVEAAWATDGAAWSTTEGSSSWSSWPGVENEVAQMEAGLRQMEL